MTTDERRRHRRQDPQQRRPRRRPAAAARARVVAAEVPRVVAASSARSRSRTTTVYLRTAISVGQEGWANFDHVKMPDYRWGIFLAEPEPDRRIAFGDHMGEPVWQEVPGRVPRRPAPPARRAGRHRAGVGRAAAAAVPDRAEPLRPAQPVPGQRRGGPPPVGDGVPAAPLLRPRRSRRGRRDARAPLGRRRPPAHPRRVQRADARLAVVLLLHLLHRPRRQVPAGVAARSQRSIRCRARATSC